MNAAAVSQLVVGPAVIATLAKAAVIAGGSSAIAKLVRADAGVAHQWMCGEAVLPAEHCSAIEALTDVPCEALRPDLHWIRAAGEVLGFLTPVDGADPAYVAQAIRNEALTGHYSAPHDAELIDGKWQADAYVAGIMHGMSVDAAEKLLADHYRDCAWTPDKLNSLAADVDEACDCDSALLYCMGMLRGLDDADHDRLLEQHKPRGWNGWTEEMSDQVWAEAQNIRRRVAQSGQAPKAMKATAAPKNEISVLGAMVGVTPCQEATVEHCLIDATAYLEAATSVARDNSDGFDSTTWASFHLVSLALGLVNAAQDKLYEFDRQKASV